MVTVLFNALWGTTSSRPPVSHSFSPSPPPLVLLFFLQRPPPPCHSLLLFLLCSSSCGRFSVLCFNPLVAASSSSSSSSSGGGSGGASSRAASSSSSPYNLTILTVEARVATVHWDISGGVPNTHPPPPPASQTPSSPTPSSSSAPSSSSTNNSDSSSSSSALENRLPSSSSPTALTPPAAAAASRITSFRITLRPTFSSETPLVSPSASSPSSPGGGGGGGGPQQRLVILQAHVRTFSFKNLTPNTEYQVHIDALTVDGPGNVSDTVTFTTLQDGETVLQRPRVQPAEVVLVVLILVAWFAAIALFLHKWGKIRIIQPREPRYKHSPKNLETIKVVKKPTDSVIHKHYTRQLSRTMVARENKRIERMNTMPNIKVNTDMSSSPSSSAASSAAAAGAGASSSSSGATASGGASLTGSGSGDFRSMRFAGHRIERKFPTMPTIEMENLSAGESQT